MLIGHHHSDATYAHHGQQRGNAPVNMGGLDTLARMTNHPGSTKTRGDLDDFEGLLATIHTRLHL